MSLRNCKTILIPVDFSRDSLEAVREGLTLSKLMKADLTLLHIVHDPAEAPGFYHKKKDRQKALHLMSDAANDMMKGFVKKHDVSQQTKKAKIKLATIVIRGIPASQIINTSKKIKAGLILMGTSGKTGLSHLLLGSTAERVTQMADVPVIIVKRSK